ncbi:MAG: efflux RND transporter periplasmic adaptor subunit [Planctomycetes bacterium]|nr:efflux RND transporter periplasmic adaptor subunit [Planctomycetota bacterium]
MRTPGLLLLATLAGSCSRAGPPPAGAALDAEPRAVRTARAETTRWPLVLRATGATRADEDATLSAKVAGRLAEVAVDLGSIVAPGDLIARAETQDLELRVSVAEAALTAALTLLGLPAEGGEGPYDPETLPAVRGARTELDEARREHQRLVELSRAGVSSRAELDRAQARLSTAEALLEDARQTAANRRAIVGQRRADLALARQALADAEVRAPFAGTVAARLASRGDYLSIGDPLARLVKVDPLRVRVLVPERDAHRVRPGQSAQIELAGLEAPRAARVARTAPALLDQSRTLVVEFDLPNAERELLPNAFAAAEIVVDAERVALSIPLDALVSFAGVEKVFLVTDGVARERRVTTGRRAAQRVEVLAGLVAGDQVVRAPGNLRGGAAVRPSDGG